MHRLLHHWCQTLQTYYLGNACMKPFSQCVHANVIKQILQQYDQIISDKTDKSDEQLQNDINKVISNMSVSNISYSNGELLNDFYHVKYDHNINDNTNQFELFYKYLFDNQDVLKCDIMHCKSAKQYYDRLNRSFDTYQDNINLNSFHLICRIHTYLIHAYE
eukprot:42429_1